MTKKVRDLTNSNERKKKSSKLFKKSKKKLEKNSLPTAPIKESNLNPNVSTGSDDDFKKAVEESKVAVQEAAQKPLKGRRGRPSLPRDANGNVIRGGNPSHPQSANTQGPAQNPGAVQGPGFQSKDLLVEPLITISKIPAKRHDIPELALDRDQSEAICTAVDKIVDAYLPDMEKMSPKKTAIIFGCLTIGGIALSKYLIYAETINQRLEAENARDSRRERAEEKIGGDALREGHATVSTTEIPRRTSKPNAFKKPDVFS